jgi:hypothetical protein
MSSDKNSPNARDALKKIVGEFVDGIREWEEVHGLEVEIVNAYREKDESFTVDLHLKQDSHRCSDSIVVKKKAIRPLEEVNQELRKLVHALNLEVIRKECPLPKQDVSSDQAYEEHRRLYAKASPQGRRYCISRALDLTKLSVELERLERIGVPKRIIARCRVRADHLLKDILDVSDHKYKRSIEESDLLE